VEWGWLAPLVLSAGVFQIYESRMRPWAVGAALLWGLIAQAIDGERPRWRPAWAAAGVAFFAGFAGSAFPARALEDLCLAAAGFVYFGGLAVWLARGDDRAARLARGILILGLARAVLAFLPVSFPAINGKPVAVSDLPNTSLIAMGLGLAAILGRSLEGRGWRIAWAILAILTAVIAVRWNAMAAFWGTGICLIAVEYVRRPRRWMGWAAAAFVMLFVLSLAGGFGPAWFRYNPSDLHRFERLRFYVELLPYVKDHWLWGTGLGTFAEYYPAYVALPDLRVANFAHNEWLQFFCETGLVGGTALVLLALGLAGRAWARRRERPQAFAALLALFLFSTVYFVFHWEFLLFLGAASAALAAPPGGRVPLRGWQGWVLVVLASAGMGVMGMQAAGRWAQGAGLRAWERGEPDRALTWMERSSRLDPTAPDPLLRRTEILRGLNRKAEALACAERALSLRPRDVWARRQVAAGRLHLAGREEACAAYRPILSLAPRVPQFRREYKEMCEDPVQDSP
jgi:O-antigen ligase